jgi:hypothetical protein
VTDDPLLRVLRPIVEGQLRGFLREHPGVLAAVDWHPREDRALTFVGSVAKRIVRDLSCAGNRARLAAALLELSPGTSPGGRAGMLPGAPAAGLETVTGPAAIPFAQRPPGSEVARYVSALLDSVGCGGTVVANGAGDRIIVCPLVPREWWGTDPIPTAVDGWPIDWIWAEEDGGKNEI